MAQILSEDRFQTAHYIVSEANGFRSREQGFIASGSGLVKPGAVLGKVATGTATPTANEGNTGNATVSAVTLGAGVKAGVYYGLILEDKSGRDEWDRVEIYSYPLFICTRPEMLLRGKAQ